MLYLLLYFFFLFFFFYFCTSKLTVDESSFFFRCESSFCVQMLRVLLKKYGRQLPLDSFFYISLSSFSTSPIICLPSSPLLPPQASSLETHSLYLILDWRGDYPYCVITEFLGCVCTIFFLCIYPCTLSRNQRKLNTKIKYRGLLYITPLQTQRTQQEI